MKLEDLIEEWDEDSRILNNADAQDYLMNRHPRMISKWSGRIARMKKNIRIMELEIENLRSKLEDYYTGMLNDMPEELVSLNRGPNPQKYHAKEKITSKVNSDELMVKRNLKLAGFHECLDFMNGVKKELEFRPSALKTALEYRKFEGY